MAANPLNFKQNHATVVAAEAALAPILTAAGITTITVAGKDVPVSDASVPDKINAIGKLIATGDKTEAAAEAFKANGELAAQLEATEGKLTAANATISAQTQKINDLTGQLNVANASIQSLTAKTVEQGRLLEAATAEAGRIQGELNALNQEISQSCIDCNVIEFKGEDNKDAASRLAAANKLSPKEKLTLQRGAINAAMSRLGLESTAGLPAAAGNMESGRLNKNLAAAAVITQLQSITDPTERARFYAANRDAITAALSANQKPK
jgi:chromosome segregation ATPase